MIAGALIWVFHADVNALIHLYVIGVFTAFTLSQAGMVRYWTRQRERGWRQRAAVNGAGALATGVVAAIVIWTKFADGAWMVIVAIPTLIATFYGIRRHYRGVARRLRAGAAAVVAAPPPHNTSLLLVESHRRRDSQGSLVRAVDRRRRLPCDPRSAAPHGSRDQSRWFRFSDEQSHLQVLDTTLGGRDAVLEQVWRLPRGESDFVTVVIPELFGRRSLAAQARRPLEFLLKWRLLTEPGVAIADVHGCRRNA